MKEKIYKIKGLEDYGITKTGKVYSYLTCKFLKPDKSYRGYCKVKLANRQIGRHVWYLVHRLVATQFIKNPRNLPEINHKDGVHHNNNIKNLEWCTREYNQRHAKETGLYKIEQDSPMAKLTKQQVLQIYKDYEQIPKKTIIARRYNVSNALIGEIIRGVRWSQTYKEYYGKESTYKKEPRKRVRDIDIYNICYKKEVENKNIQSISKEVNLSQKTVYCITNGTKYNDKYKQCLKEIKNRLGNQQPNN